MSRNSKCSYCRDEGHTIRYCGSGKLLYERVKSSAIDHIVLENRTTHGTIHERAKLFYTFLVDCYSVVELKLILYRRECRVNGNKQQLAARFVHSYFITELGLCQFPHRITDADRRNIHTYLTYWKDLSEGKNLIKELENKFPINVVMKTVDLEQSFECAICMEEQCPILDQVELGCNHSFCNSCVSIILKNSQNKKTHPCCAVCRAKFEKIQVHTNKMIQDYNTRFCYNC
jgi:hypothetical protein